MGVAKVAPSRERREVKRKTSVPRMFIIINKKEGGAAFSFIMHGTPPPLPPRIGRISSPVAPGHAQRVASWNATSILKGDPTGGPPGNGGLRVLLLVLLQAIEGAQTRHRTHHAWDSSSDGQPQERDTKAGLVVGHQENMNMAM